MIRGVLILVLVCVLQCVYCEHASSQLAQIPPALEPWQNWVNASVKHRDCPKVFNDHGTAVCFWPSQLVLEAKADGAQWSQQVSVYEKSWVPLPGDLSMWPTDVRVDGRQEVVIGRDGRPCVELSSGAHQIEGGFRWAQMPQRIRIPAETGVLSLSVLGEARPLTSWGGDGEIWLRRVQSAPADVDRLGVQVYRVIEDGIPVWLRTEVELTVSGKSREEELGWILPEGWRIANISSSLPVAIDDVGRIKTQVRAGKWSIEISAFSTADPKQIQYASGVQPVRDLELIGLRQDPSFRVSLIEGLAAVDVSQTTFPERWRGVPVYQWDTSTALSFREKQRGMGEKGQEGLKIAREIWLDDSGNAFTYEDKLTGHMQQIWRLNASPGMELGSVRINGENQLITKSPDGQASGVELRNRNLDLTAIGRSSLDGSISATGWQADTDALSVVFTLPPGWRAIAIFGADRVVGDWMTAWSLLDLFLLMIFSLAVFRLYGWFPGLIALLAFGLSYHEYGSPRWTWFCLLVPLALAKVVRSEMGLVWLTRIRFIAALLLMSFLIPFVAHQCQSVIYPQLEVSGVTYGYRDFLAWMGDAPNAVPAPSGAYRSMAKGSVSKQVQRGKQLKGIMQQQSASSANLLFDPKSKIQTGPARPTWSWNRVVCTWNGPVTAQDEIKPVLLSLGQNRILTVVRIVLMSLLALFFLTSGKGFRWQVNRRALGAVAALFLFVGLSGQADAQQPPGIDLSANQAFEPQNRVNPASEIGSALGNAPQFDLFPSQALLDELRQRLNEVPSAFPHAAELAAVNLELGSGILKMDLTFHVAHRVAVPIPGRFPDWSPMSVTFSDGRPAVTVRKDDYLWVLLPEGIHQLSVQGAMPDQSDWEWGYLLKPKFVNVVAPGWSISGLRADGVPSDQLLFAKEQPVDEETAEYDQVRTDPIVLVDRQLEIGLVSRVKTTVTRLGDGNKSIALPIPLLEGEAVLTPNREVADGNILMRLGSQGGRFEWISELQHQQVIQLTAAKSNQFVERWSLATSPIWNVAIDGLQPIFESGSDQLIPVWRPWGGESVSLRLNRPIGINGDNLTITGVKHAVSVGVRQRVTDLQIDLDCSLSTDFTMELAAEAEVSSIKMNGTEVPQQRDGNKLLIPVSPGQHQLNISWTVSQLLTHQIAGEFVGVPVDASNVTSTIQMPDNRWVLWAAGPLRGPAVRFWTVLVVAVVLAFVLAIVPASPLRRFEWALLMIGLTQVNLFAGMFVVGWLFALEYRGKHDGSHLSWWRFNFHQLSLVLLTLVALTVLVFVVAAGLLGYPDMFILGNGSSRTFLHWFTPRAGTSLPVPSVISVSVWGYRVLMLCWALWLASALLRWLARGWGHFTSGGAWKSRWFQAKGNPPEVSRGAELTAKSSAVSTGSETPVDAELVDEEKANKREDDLS